MSDWWRYSDSAEIFRIAILVIVSTVLLITAIGWALDSLQERACHAAWSDYDPQYSFTEGCRISVNGKMTPVSAFREINP